MTKEKELSLDEMIKLARMVQYWESVDNGSNVSVAYEGAVGNLSVDVLIVNPSYRLLEGNSGPNRDWGEATSYIKIYKDIIVLGDATGRRVNEIVDLAEKKYVERMGLSRTALMKEAKALLRKDKAK